MKQRQHGGPFGGMDALGKIRWMLEQFESCSALAHRYLDVGAGAPIRRCRPWAKVQVLRFARLGENVAVDTLRRWREFGLDAIVVDVRATCWTVKHFLDCAREPA